MRRILVIAMVSLSCIGTLWAKGTTVKTVIRTWHFPSPTGIADTTKIDTSYMNLPMQDVIGNYSLASASNGNFVSPSEPRIFFDRQRHVDDLFAQAYQPFTITGQQVRFYNTTTPYSRITYKHGFTSYHEENEINFLFTGNLNRKTNLGLELNYLDGAGHYENQAGKTFNGSVFGCYNGDHYSIHAAFLWNNLSSFDNGGICNVADLASSLQPEDIPIRLRAMSGYRYLSGYINHSYSICVERMINDTDKVYIPATTFNHLLDINNSNRRYIEHNACQQFYEHNYIDSLSTNDSTDVLTISNTLSVRFEEEFNKWLKFGATIYATNECQRFLTNRGDILLPMPVDSIWDYHWTNNTFLGGALYKNRGKWVHYGFEGDVCLIGYKLGEFHVDGHIDGHFPVGKDTMYLSANAYVRNQTPDYYLSHYHSNHYQWDNNWDKTYRFFVGGQVAYPTKWVKTKVDIGFENLTKYIYFAQNGLPTQHDGNIQILKVDAQVDLTTPWVNLENHVIYQLSSNKQVLDLPSFTLYHNLYYHGCWFKALDAQLGVDFRYFTAYYAPVLCPATAQFCAQQEELIGNYPWVNIYANFYVRSIRLKFFAHYTHINHLFMKQYTNYQSMPSYPMNPDVFRMGVAWHFYK